MPEPAECDNCGLVFPLREGSGLCPKCVKLKGLKNGTDDYNDVAVSSLFAFTSSSYLFLFPEMGTVQDVWYITEKFSNAGAGMSRSGMQAATCYDSRCIWLQVHSYCNRWWWGILFMFVAIEVYTVTQQVAALCNQTIWPN